MSPSDPIGLQLVGQALMAKLALELGEKDTARRALAELGRLLPLARIEAQQLPDPVDDDEELLDLPELLAAAHPTEPRVSAPEEDS